MSYKIHKQYRFPEYNYSQVGMYFITICTQERIKYFGNVVNEKMQLNRIGKIANQFWLKIPEHFKDVILDEYIIMPNHVHGIISIDRDILIEHDEHDGRRRVGTGHCPVQINGKINRTGQCPVPTDEHSTFGHVLPQSISTIIGSFKSICTKTINKKYPNLKFGWQTRFYDNIIRNETALNNIRNYIQNNPSKWKMDRNNKNF